MSDLQTEILNRLNSNTSYKFIDNSFTKFKPVSPDMVEFIQEYACGWMMDSDIIIVLPDSTKDNDFSEEGDSLDILSQAPFRGNRDLNSLSVYTVELQTLIFDSCNTKPVLVLGWTKEKAEYLISLLKKPKVLENPNNKADRFYPMGINEISEINSIAKRIVSILNNYNMQN